MTFMDNSGVTFLSSQIISLNPGKRARNEIHELQNRLFLSESLLDPVILPPSIITGVFPSGEESLSLPFIEKSEEDLTFDKVVEHEGRWYLTSDRLNESVMYKTMKERGSDAPAGFPIHPFGGFGLGRNRPQRIFPITVSDWSVVHVHLTVAVQKGSIVHSFYRILREIHLK